MNQPAKNLYEFGPFRLDARERRLLRDGEPVLLTPKVFDILLLLVEHVGHMVEKDEMMRALWPDSFVEESNLTRNISMLRKALGEREGESQYIETIPKWGYRFVAQVREWRDEDAAGSGQEHTTNAPAVAAPGKLEPVGGAVPLDSRFYIERETDAEFQAAVARRDSIVLVKGARQVGKTSLLARSLQQAREAGAKVVLTDFQRLNASHLESIDALFLMLAKLMAKQLDLEVLPHQVWDPDLGPSMNFASYVEREVLGHVSAPLVWGMDEVDRLFTCEFGSEVFGLFRSWHNARSLDPQGPWRRLTLAMAYATEAHLFITDMYQSPFNVGTRLLLEDFTLAQVAELNQRYGSPLQAAEVEDYFRLVGGHPYLVRRGLYQMVTQGTSLAALQAQADHDEGPFGDHLRRLLISLKQDAALCEVARGVLQGQGCPTAESFYRLRSAGVIVGDAGDQVQPRTQLYATYLRRHLL